MRPASAQFLAALRTPHSVDIRVEAWRGGVRVGGTLNVLGGHVEAAASRYSSPRRTLRLELSPTPGLWDALAPFGTTLHVYRGIRYIDGTVEHIRVGTFEIDEQSLVFGPEGTLSLTAPDLWVKVQRARFEMGETTSGSILDSAVRLATAAGLARGMIRGKSAVTAPARFWDRDRAAAIEELASDAGVWIYVDALGRVTARPVPSIRQTPVWTIDASASGVMLDASVSRNRQRTYNVILVHAIAPEGSGPFLTTVADDDPASPTWVGGPFGRVPYFWQSNLITSDEGARTAGRAMLRRHSGLAAQVELTSIVNPALEPGDVITVLFPKREGETRRVQRHLIDSVSIPLTADGTQSISTRSNRPEGELPEEYAEDVWDSLVTDDQG